MKDYNKFLETKRKSFIDSGFDIDESKLNKNLFDFQKFAVKTALRKGKFALFFDCGLGKTLMQLSWSEAVFNETKKKVLVLAPLAVVEQTKEEAVKFGINSDCFDITNYDQLKNIDISIYSGVVLDESSILKGKDGKTSDLIIK
jgi:reverse gyrase